MTSEVVQDLDSLIAAGRQFACIYGDPPWRYDSNAGRGAAENHYPTMTMAALREMPVAQLATDNAVLHLWTTNAFLKEALDLMKTWGFTYTDLFVWAKPQMGMGSYWRCSHEFLLLGLRGHPSFATDAKSYVVLPRKRHSEKPHFTRELIEWASPSPYLELFGRKAVQGWCVFGNQVEVA